MSDKNESLPSPPPPPPPFAGSHSPGLPTLEAAFEYTSSSNILTPSSLATGSSDKPIKKIDMKSARNITILETYPLISIISSINSGKNLINPESTFPSNTSANATTDPTREKRLRQIIHNLEEQHRVVRENIRAQAVELKQQLDRDLSLGLGPGTSSNTMLNPAISAQEMQAVASSLAAPWVMNTSLDGVQVMPTTNAGSTSANSGPTSPTSPTSPASPRGDKEDPYTAIFNDAQKQLELYNQKMGRVVAWYRNELEKLKMAPDSSLVPTREGSVSVQSPGIDQAQNTSSAVSMGPPTGFPSKNPS